MYRAWLRHAARSKPHTSFRTPGERLQLSTKPELPPKAPASKTRARLDRWIVKSPNFFKPTLKSLRDAPASYVMSFAILHEITAVVPLVALAFGFHYFRWLPPYFAEGKWVIEGVEKFGRYARKKGWMQEKDKTKAEEETKKGKARLYEKSTISRAWNNREDRGRWLIEFATAWAVVKALLPLRIMLSVWAAPPFARLALIPTGNAVRIAWRWIMTI